MTCDCDGKCNCKKSNRAMHNTAAWGFPSFLAYIGAAIYFISMTNGGFWVVVLALLKAAVWPAYVVFHVLKLLGA